MLKGLFRSGMVAAALMAMAALTPGHAQTKVAIGYVPVGDFLPAFVAADKGYFKDAGIDASLVAVPLATNVPAAIVSGSVQIGMTTTPIMFQARENGIDLVAISGLTWDTRAHPQLSLVVRKDSGITKPADLVGKKIAFPGLKSLFDSAMIQWLKDKGVDPAKVIFVEAQMPQLADLLRSGNVDAITPLDPFRARAISDGSGVKLADFLVDLGDDQPLAYWMTSRDFAKAHPADVKAFNAAIEKALAFIGTNADEARQIGAKYMRGNILASFPNWKTAITPADMQKQTDMELAVGVLTQKADVNAAFVK